jgi:hypothetical protein
MGTGMGSVRGADTRATFQWQSSDDRTGTMNASLSNGNQYTGQFFQVTHDTRIETLEPLWAGWGPGWHGWGWRYWGSQPDTAFVTHYSGRVVANLQDADGDHMRCHFQLMHPQRGMGGGGQGECQLPSGQTIDATFPKA